MQVRHNTTLLEKAVNLVVLRAAIPTEKARADAALKHAEAIAKRRLATGVAIAVAAVGIGLGLMFGLGRRDASSQIASRPSESNVTPTPSTSAHDAKTVRYDVTKFAEKAVDFLGRKWVITSGHHFDNDSASNWKSAWCYVVQNVEGVAVQIGLARRDSPQAVPVALTATAETLAKSGLDGAAGLALATKCPWLDRKTFRVEDFYIPKDRQTIFSKNMALFESNGRTLLFTGPIERDFLTSLQRRDFDKLIVDSRGGLMAQAISAADWLRKSGKTVEVRNVCLSACVFVLAGGIVRLAAADAHIGVHRFYSTKEEASHKDIEVGQQVASDVIRFLDRMGVDQALFHSMANVASEDMAVINHATLTRWRLLSATPAASEPKGIPLEPLSTTASPAALLPSSAFPPTSAGLGLPPIVPPRPPASPPMELGKAAPPPPAIFQRPLPTKGDPSRFGVY